MGTTIDILLFNFLSSTANGERALGLVPFASGAYMHNVLPKKTKNQMIAFITGEMKKLNFKSPEREEKATNLVRFMLKELILQEKTFSDYVDLPSNLLRQKYMCGHNYERVMKEIRGMGIIEPYRNRNGEETYSKEKKQPKSYRLVLLNLLHQTQKDKLLSYGISNLEEENENQLYRFLLEVIIDEIKGCACNTGMNGDGSPYSRNQRILLPSMSLTYNQCPSPPRTIEEYTKTNILSLQFDCNELIEIVRERIDNPEKDMKFSWEKETGRIFYRYINSAGKTGLKYYASKTRKDAQDVAGMDGKSFIEYKHNYYIAYKDAFIQNIREKRLLAYSTILRRLLLGHNNPRRNDKNRRMDSLITNMPKCIMNYLMVKNGLMQLDLVNSQFAIQAFTMKKEGVRDYAFEKASQAGELYEEMQKFFGVDNRDDMKQMAMVMQFSRNGAFKEVKVELRRMFPVMCDYSENEKNSDHRSLAVKLQQKESEIFIDRIFTRLFSMGIWSLTIHDSIICKIEDRRLVYDIIMEEFEKIGFLGRIRPNEDEWNRMNRLAAE